MILAVNVRSVCPSSGRWFPIQRLHKGIQTVFGNQAVIQRCQWHKWGNVISKISDPSTAKGVRKTLKTVYTAPTYTQAKEQLPALIVFWKTDIPGQRPV